MMKRVVFILTIAAMCVASSAHAAIIAIENPSFEAQAGEVGGGGFILGETDGEWSGGATGWYGGSGVHNPAPVDMDPETTDGLLASWTNTGGYLAQSMVYEDGSPVLVEANQTYTFTFDLGLRTNTGIPTELWFEIWAGGVWVTNTSFDVSDQALGTWTTREVTLELTDNQTQLGVQPDLALYNPAGQISTDNWSATVVPEPATMVLLGVGGLALIRRKKR